MEFCISEKTYSQSEDLDFENVSMHINTEGAELEELEFKGFSAKYYSNRGVQNLLWHDDEHMYMVSSTLGRATVFKIADSVDVSLSLGLVLGLAGLAAFTTGLIFLGFIRLKTFLRRLLPY